MGIATNQTFKSTTIDEFGFRQIILLGLRKCCTLRHTCHFAVEVDVSTVFLVLFFILFRQVCSLIFQNVGCGVASAFSDCSLFAATKDLEYVSLIQVDGGAAPYFRVFTITTTKNAQCGTKHVHTLFVENDTRTTCRDFITLLFVSVKDRLALFICGHTIEHTVLTIAVNDGAIDVDNHITIHKSALVAASVDIATPEATSDIVCRSINFCIFGSRNKRGVISCVQILRTIHKGVPLQLTVTIAVQIIDLLVVHSLHLPPHRLYLQTCQIKLQLVTIGVGIATDTAFIFCIPICRLNVCCIAPTNELIENDDRMLESDSLLAIHDHTTHITTTIERAKLGGIRFIGSHIIKHDLWLYPHSASFHVFGKHSRICQVHGVELAGACFRESETAIRRVHVHIFSEQSQRIGFIIGCHHILTIVTEEHLIGDDIRANLQLSRCIFIRIIVAQCCAVTTTIDGTTNDGGLGFCTYHTDRHSLSIGAESI